MINRHFARFGFIVLMALALVFNASLAQEHAPDSVADTTTIHNHGEPPDPTNEHESGDAAAPVEEEREPTLWEILTIPKYLAMTGVMVVAIGLLFVRKFNRWIRLGGLALAFALFGLDTIFSIHPSPMCATTKLFMFRFTWGQWFVGFLAYFLIIFVPGIIYRKAFCGWVCPLGAFQELINKIPNKWRIKQFNFTAFNSVRLGLLAMFFVTFFMVRSEMQALGTELGHTDLPIWKAYSAYSLYDPINYFEYLHWSIETQWIIMMSILVIASLIIYRPFCYLICPIGAVSWFLEKVSLGKIRIDRSKCNDCGVCVIKSPCPTIMPLLKGDKIGLPDCTSCGECLSTCNRDAIKFSFKKL